MNNTDEQELQQLRMLSIFHYIVAAFIGLFSLVPLIHLGIGIAIVVGAFDIPNSQEAPPVFIGWFFIAFASTIILLGLACAVCTAIAGGRLAQLRSYTFCFVVACILCFVFPFGTVLGVLTILALLRPSVKQKFDLAQLGS
jgi:hypothetical protein